MSYAQGTTVAVPKTRGEIEALVGKYGASEFSSGWMAGQAAIQFAVKGRRVRFSVTMPTRDWARAHFKKRKPSVWYPTDVKLADAVAAEERRLWRCMLIAIKSKLEAVESGIASFDEEFLAYIVVDNNETVFERITHFDGGRLLPAVSP